MSLPVTRGSESKHVTAGAADTEGTTAGPIRPEHRRTSHVTSPCLVSCPTFQVHHCYQVLSVCSQSFATLCCFNTQVKRHLLMCQESELDWTDGLCN